jgi:hypothetical protein
LCAQHVRYGDLISFAPWDRSAGPLDAVIARGEDQRLSAVLVHLSDKALTYSVSDLDRGLANCDVLLKLDEGTGNRVVSGKCTGEVMFEGYGVAVVTNIAPSQHEDERVA